MSDLFAQASKFLKRDPYANLGDASGFNTKIAGVSFEGRQDLVSALSPGMLLELRRQPDNPYDSNAIEVYYGTLHLG
ncbi:MAG: HIRAN domain-containing protein, partial [Candidatus Eremiobacteraeota bacterium]|nr:HIRAN domain-containing protein [Candidatus Eremiobacteraeota bacterium]